MVSAIDVVSTMCDISCAATFGKLRCRSCTATCGFLQRGCCLYQSCAATNEKLHCNIQTAALQESVAFLSLSCGFQAPTFRLSRLGSVRWTKMTQNGHNDHFGQNGLILNWILAFARPNGPKGSILVHFRSILVHLGPSTVLWPLLRHAGFSHAIQGKGPKGLF